jgi:hypothetical protein
MTSTSISISHIHGRFKWQSVELGRKERSNGQKDDILESVGQHIFPVHFHTRVKHRLTMVVNIQNQLDI